VTLSVFTKREREKTSNVASVLFLFERKAVMQRARYWNWEFYNFYRIWGIYWLKQEKCGCEMLYRAADVTSWKNVIQVCELWNISRSFLLAQQLCIISTEVTSHCSWSCSRAAWVWIQGLPSLDENYNDFCHSDFCRNQTLIFYTSWLNRSWECTFVIV